MEDAPRIPRGGGRETDGGPRVGPQPLRLSDDQRVGKLLAELLERQARQAADLDRAQAEAQELADDARRAREEADALSARLETRHGELLSRAEAAEAHVDELRRQLEEARVGRQADATERDARLAALESERDEARRARDLAEETLGTVQDELADARAAAAAAEEQVRAAEEARNRAQQGTSSFQRMVEDARGRALAARRAAEESDEARADAERQAADATRRAEEAEALVAHLDLELTRAREAAAATPATPEPAAVPGESRDDEPVDVTRADDTPLLDALLGLADLELVDELGRRQGRLWPPHPEQVPHLEAWEQDALALAARLDGHRARAAALERLDGLLDADDRARGWELRPDGWTRLLEAPADATVAREEVLAPPAGAGDATADTGAPRWSAATLTWWREGAARLVEALADLVDPRDGTLADVRRRLEVARGLDERTRTGADARAAWEAAAEAVADRAQHPAYDGLRLAPQLGLLPLGPDPASGLWEFWMPHTGDEPRRDEAGALVLEEDSAVVLVLLQAGTARLGARRPSGRGADAADGRTDPAARRNEGPVHEVDLAPCFLGKFALTQSQWQRLTGHNPSRYKAGMRLAGREHTGLHPVEWVDWHTADRTLRRWGLCLPTEARWEYGARGGTDTPWWTGPGRDSLRDTVNLADQAAARGGASWAAIQDWPELDDGYTVHAPVDHGRPNPFGLHAVHGNVWEWCADVFGGYDLPVREGDGLRLGAEDGPRVFRGGGFRNTAAQSRSASRQGDVAEKVSSDLGVRAARPLEPAEDA